MQCCRVDPRPEVGSPRDWRADCRPGQTRRATAPNPAWTARPEGVHSYAYPIARNRSTESLVGEKGECRSDRGVRDWLVLALAQRDGAPKPVWLRKQTPSERYARGPWSRPPLPTILVVLPLRCHLLQP